MNVTAILALIGDLYNQITQLQAEVERLKKELDNDS